VLWLNRGIAGDDTHGHIDDLARFTGPRTVVTVVRGGPEGRELRTRYKKPGVVARHDRRGRAEVARRALPMPEPVVFRKQRLPASYANFYIANDRVLVPTFNARQDRLALGVLAEFVPGRKIVGIHAVDLVWGWGRCTA